MKEKKNHFLPYLMIAPAAILMLVVVFYPIITSIIRSFQLESGGYGIDNYIYFFTDEMQTHNLLYTMEVVVITVVLAIVIAFLLALYLRFSNSRVSRWISSLYLIPRFVPGLVAVNGMITVIRDSGLINRISVAFGGDFKLGFMYNQSGLILMNLWFNIPFATMLIASALSSIPDSVVEAAQDAGAGKLKILTKMILPLTVKDSLIAATFVFMSNIGSFTTPYLMGDNYPEMLGVTLYELFNNLHYEQAAALSVIIFLLSSISAVVYIVVNMKKNAWEESN